YMEEVQALCPRIAILDNGMLRACDTLPNLLKRLNATIRVTVANAPGGFAERLAAIPGVKSVKPAPPSPPSLKGRGKEEPLAASREAREGPLAKPQAASNSPLPFREGGPGGVGLANSQGAASSFELVV